MPCAQLRRKQSERAQFQGSSLNGTTTLREGNFCMIDFFLGRLMLDGARVDAKMLATYRVRARPMAGIGPAGISQASAG
jgi:hypothetical protein